MFCVTRQELCDQTQGNFYLWDPRDWGFRRLGQQVVCTTKARRAAQTAVVYVQGGAV
jgi:hypothetical protein